LTPAPSPTFQCIDPLPLPLNSWRRSWGGVEGERGEVIQGEKSNDNMGVVNLLPTGDNMRVVNLLPTGDNMRVVNLLSTGDNMRVVNLLPTGHNMGVVNVLPTGVSPMRVFTSRLAPFSNNISNTGS